VWGHAANVIDPVAEREHKFHSMAARFGDLRRDSCGVRRSFGPKALPLKLLCLAPRKRRLERALRFGGTRLRCLGQLDRPG